MIKNQQVEQLDDVKSIKSVKSVGSRRFERATENNKKRLPAIKFKLSENIRYMSPDANNCKINIQSLKYKQNINQETNRIVNQKVILVNQRAAFTQSQEKLQSELNILKSKNVNLQKKAKELILIREFMAERQTYISQITQENIKLRQQIQTLTKQKIKIMNQLQQQKQKTAKHNQLIVKISQLQKYCKQKDKQIQRFKPFEKEDNIKNIRQVKQCTTPQNKKKSQQTNQLQFKTILKSKSANLLRIDLHDQISTPLLIKHATSIQKQSEYQERDEKNQLYCSSNNLESHNILQSPSPKQLNDLKYSLRSKQIENDILKRNKLDLDIHKKNYQKLLKENKQLRSCNSILRQISTKDRRRGGDSLEFSLSPNKK